MFGHPLSQETVVFFSIFQRGRGDVRASFQFLSFTKRKQAHSCIISQVKRVSD